MKYKVIEPIKYGGRRYAPGETLELPDAIAASALIGTGVIVPAATGRAPEPTPESSASPDDPGVAPDAATTKPAGKRPGGKAA